jgi:uncharacterized protein (TIGR02594 family)
MHRFADLKALVSVEAHNRFGEAAGPVMIALVTNGTWWTIKDTIKYVSEWLVLCGNMLAFAAGVWAFYVTWRANRAGKASHMDTAKAAGSAAAAASKASPIALLILAVVTLGGYLIVHAWKAYRAPEVAPLAIMAAPAAQGRKRKSKDDAGDDGDVEPAQIPDGAPKWMVSAHELLGVSERTSRGGSNPVISAMFEHTQLVGKVDARKVPWCAAFCNAMLERNGYPGTKSAMARSFLKWGVPLDKPRPGCIVVIWRGEYDNGENGHVFFYTREDALYVYGIGGNQGDAISEARFHKSKLLGYRWPRSPVKSKTNVGIAVAGGATAAGVGVQASSELLPAPTVETVNKVAEAATKSGDAAAKAGEAIEKAREPLQQAATALQGTKIAKYIVLALSAMALAGLVLAYYGRKSIRDNHGI